MDDRLDQFMEDFFFPYNQGSFFIYTITMNLYLQRHYHYLKYDNKIFTVKKVVDEISEQHEKFGYSDQSVQVSIRDLHKMEIIKTGKEGREKAILLTYS